MSLWGTRALARLKRQAPTAASCLMAKRRGGVDGASALRRCPSPSDISRLLASARLSSTDAASAPSASECAHHLSELSASSEAASELARRLSPAARREIAEARREVGEVAGVAAEAAEAVPEPSQRDLYLVALNNGIPFVGFGIMDNAILIWAGDAIDTSLGVAFGISTLCAAAIGNIISDLAGVGLGTAIEEFAARLKIPQPNITQMQRTLRSVRFASQFGCAFGITIGCIIGMFPLYFIDTKKVEKMKQEAHLDSIFHDMVTEANSLIGAEHTCLYTVVESEKDRLPLPFCDRQEIGQGKFLYGGYRDECTDGSQVRCKHSHVPIGKGILSSAVLTGKTINIRDARIEPDFDFDKDVFTNIPKDEVKNMLCVPVLDAHGRVIAIIQATNKEEHSKKARGFTSEDTRVLRALATHVSVSLENMHGDDGNMSLRDTISILKEHGTSSLGRYRTKRPTRRPIDHT